MTYTCHFSRSLASWRLYTMDRLGPPFTTVAAVSNRTNLAFAVRGFAEVQIMLSDDSDAVPFKVVRLHPIMERCMA